MILGIALGAIGMLLALYALSFVTRDRRSAVTVIDMETGTKKVTFAPRPPRKRRVKNGKNVGPNDVIGAGENVQAVIRRGR